MVTPIWKLQRELAYAQAREAYYNNTARPLKTTVDAAPRTPVVYYPLFIKNGAAAPAFKLFASRKAITQFGEAAALGLIVTDSVIADAENPSRSFAPSMIRMMLGDGTPTAVRAFNGTGRRYVKYARPSTGDAQAHFNAPISAGDATPTLPAVEAKLAAIAAAKKASIGDYGRIWMDLEKYTKSVA